MGSTFYLFYMVLFTGGVLWCLFLWLVKDDEEEKGEAGEAQPTEASSPAASRRALPPGEAK